jgi:hypothetical protein
MRKLALLILLPSISVAQQKYLLPSIAFAATAIYNKEDVKHDLLPSKLSFAPALGIGIGRQKGKLFYEASINYNPIIQQYKGWHFYPDNPNNIASASKLLNYLQACFFIGKHISLSDKAKFFVQGGPSINYLLSYKTKYHAVFSTNGSTNPADASIDYIQQGNTINMKDQGTSAAEYETSEWYFQKLLPNLHLNLGVDLQLTNKVALRIASNNFFSVLNPENTTQMQLGLKNGNFDPLALGSKSTLTPYDRYSGIVSGRWGLLKRPESRLLSTALSVGAKFSLNN